MHHTMSLDKSLSNNTNNVTALYTRGQEVFNGASHFFGVGLGTIFGLVLFLLLPENAPLPSMFAMGIYTFSTVWLYLASALYHIVPVGRVKSVLRVFDHCSIFIIIAGCYTPFCLISLWDYPMGKIIFAVEWVLAVGGIVLNAIDMHNKIVKKFSMLLYVVMGWMIVLAVDDLLLEVNASCFTWLLVGGIFYTLGIVFYALGKKKAVMHCVWHIFVLLGTAFQFVSILYLV